MGLTSWSSCQHGDCGIQCATSSGASSANLSAYPKHIYIQWKYRLNTYSMHTTDIVLLRRYCPQEREGYSENVQNILSSEQKDKRVNRLDSQIMQYYCEENEWNYNRRIGTGLLLIICIHCAQLLLVKVNFTFNLAPAPEARLPLHPVVSWAQKIIRYR